MYKAKVIGIKEDLFDFISTLRHIRSFHVDEQPTKGEFDQEIEFRDIRLNLESLETRIASILSYLRPEDLELVQEVDSRPNELIIEEAKNLLTIIEPKIQKIQSEKLSANAKIRQMERYLPILRRIESLSVQIEEKRTLESIIVVFDRRSEIGFVEFEKEINDRTKGLYELSHKPVDEHYDAVLLLIDRRFVKETYSYLTSERISELDFPTELRNVKLRHMQNTVLELISKQKNVINDLIDEENEFINSPEFNKTLNFQKEILTRLNEFELASKMGGTAETFEIEGFVPKSKWKDFVSNLTDKFGKRIVIQRSKAKKDAPVLRTNPWMVKPFEIITDMIQLPEYGSIDPTPLIFIFFPFFWGFMVGDVGYAATIMVIAIILRMRFKKNQQQALQRISEIFIISTIWAMFFGILYLEVFGNVVERMHLGIHPILDRYHNVEELLVISVIVGYLIIMGGMALSVYNNLALGHKSHVYANLLLIFIWGSISVLIGVGIIVPELFSTILLADATLIVLAMLFLIKFEGIAGLIHVIEKFSNILSFARLMAIGLVGAWMGFIANDLIHPAHGDSLGLFGILLGLGLHMINIVILILSPSIHAMRLNVYEFFSQFVIGGGNTFQPFGTPK